MTRYFNWPARLPRGEWWKKLAQRIKAYPAGKQQSWGLPFEMGKGHGRRVIFVNNKHAPVIIPINAQATYLCFLHEWPQIPEAIRWNDPAEGLVVAEYELRYADGTQHIQPVRGRFEVNMAESPGSAWLALAFNMWRAIDPVAPPPQGMQWGRAQHGLDFASGLPLVYAMANPYPGKKIGSLVIRGIQTSPLLVSGLTIYSGAAHPLAHLSRRAYRLKSAGHPRVQKAAVDLGGVARIEQTTGPRGKKWLKSPYMGVAQAVEPGAGTEDIIHAFGARDATLALTLAGRKKPLKFSLGQAFVKGKSSAALQPDVQIEALDKARQWMRLRVIDGSTGKPTAVRLHLSGAKGEYLAPYGHHAQINANWFEDYGADVLLGGRNYAYVSGEFTTDMPVGDVYVEICKGFEYEPIRRKVTIRPGQKLLELTINRWKDLRAKGWVTADTHVHFISPQTAWLQAQAEGINVVNLLASQWGRLFTNVGDYTGRVGVVEDDTIVYVGTENRNHMLGHMSMLGTKGLPVFPMCCGGPTEAWVGDPDFMSMAEWALENKRKGGVVIRPHYPYCGHTEDPVPILKGLVDALEININRGGGFPVQEWYRYLNCGYRVAVAGGTDKMSAGTALGWMRTYAQLDANKPFSYDRWAQAVHAGRTISTNGPLLDLQVEGRGIGATIGLPSSGGTLGFRAEAACFWPLGQIEVVCNGKVIACDSARQGARQLALRGRIKMTGSGWIAARCYGYAGHPASYMAAHTSPVYIKCGATRAFDGPAAEHMLSLVEGGVEYLNTLAMVFDESARRRMVKLFNEVRQELLGRLIAEAGYQPHYEVGHYHTHGHARPTALPLT
ncbi:MAG: CehA/McbA family metallohydrolase [Lentisphaerae bacterium]|nr:CehA/McbA family metallohydrolase [Lentisphaerota bacterium]